MRAKGERSRERRAPLVARQAAPRHGPKIESAVRGMLKAFGIKLPAGRRPPP